MAGLKQKKAYFNNRFIRFFCSSLNFKFNLNKKNTPKKKLFGKKLNQFLKITMRFLIKYSKIETN